MSLISGILHLHGNFCITAVWDQLSRWVGSCSQHTSCWLAFPTMTQLLTFSTWHQLVPEANNPIMTSEETYIWKAVLTNYTHSQWCPVLCFSSKICQEFSETATSKARRCSGFVRNFIGGNNSALLGLLLKYEQGHGIGSLSATMVNNHWFLSQILKGWSLP